MKIQAYALEAKSTEIYVAVVAKRDWQRFNIISQWWLAPTWALWSTEMSNQEQEHQKAIILFTWVVFSSGSSKRSSSDDDDDDHILRHRLEDQRWQEAGG